MAKIITKLGACSTKNKPIGVQLKNDGSGFAVAGTYSVSGDSAIVSAEEVGANITLDKNFIAHGCKLCGNKYMFRCGGCGRFICYDGRAKRAFKCPVCGRTADVPAAYGNGAVPTTNASPIRKAASGTVQLSQGEIAPIALPSGEPLSRIKVGVGWDPATFGVQMDVDSSVVVAGRDERDIVYFCDLTHPSGCVVHHGDNLTGEDRGNGDDENIDVYLDKVPSNRDRLYFVLNIFNCAKTHQKLKNVKNMYIRLYDPISKEALVEYKVTEDLENDTALVIGVAYREGREWMFKAIGKGSKAEDIHRLADEVSGLN